MGIRFRFGKKVAFLKIASLAKGFAYNLGLGNLFWSPVLGKRLGSAYTFRVVAVGREGYVPTVDVKPISLGA